MKNLIYIFLLVFASCKDSDYSPTLQQQLQGEWSRTDDPNRHYIFGEGYVTTWDYNFSTVIAPKWYKAEQVGDNDLMLVEMNTKDTTVWIFSEVSDVVTVGDCGVNPTFYFNLKRE